MSGYDTSGASPDQQSDQELIRDTARGDSQAYAELWSRHYTYGFRAAQAISSTIEPEDLVQEAFTRIYLSIKRGGGPQRAFRSYLYSAIRNTAATWGRKRARELPHDEFADLPDPRFDDSAAEVQAETEFAIEAYRQLPPRWQEVLWYLNVENMKPSEVAQLLGLSAHAVSQLGMRAREGLRDAWVSAHIIDPKLAEECRWVSQRMGKYSRSRSSERERNRIEGHLASCVQCRKALSQVKEIVTQLRLSAFGIFFSSAAATGILTKFDPNSPTSSLNTAAQVMPDSVIQSDRAGFLNALTVTKAGFALGVSALGVSLWLLPPDAPDTTIVTIESPPLFAPQEDTQETPEVENPVDPATEEPPQAQSETVPEEAISVIPTPESNSETAQVQKPELEPRVLGAPTLWNFSRASDETGFYSITAMFGGEDNADVVAFLSGAEVARGSGSSPQLIFTVTAQQFESADLQFAFVVHGTRGPLTEVRTPAEWSGAAPK